MSMIRFLFCLFAGITFSIHADIQQTTQLLNQTGIKGGLLLHLGCGDGIMSSEFYSVYDRFLVHGLDFDASGIVTAQENIRNRGNYGRVSAEYWNASVLPHGENVVNLAVVESFNGISVSEIVRVLAPQGIGMLSLSAGFTESTLRNSLSNAGIAQADRVDVAGSWLRFEKPRPSNIDDWGHWKANASGTMVSKDTKVGYPKRIQWVAGPRWARHHEAAPTIQATVTANGKLYYILDESPVSVPKVIEYRWTLVARDAFNGLELWRRPFPALSWGPEAWSNTADEVFSNEWTIPDNAPRRIVAYGDNLYITMGYRDVPILEIDGATGETLREIPNTSTCEDFVIHDGLLIQHYKSTQWAHNLGAIDLATGQTIWSTSRITSFVQHAAYGDMVFALSSDQTIGIIAYDLNTGAEIWRSSGMTIKDPQDWIAVNDHAVFAWQKRDSDPAKVLESNKVIAFSRTTGNHLWDHQVHIAHYVTVGHRSLNNVFVMEDNVWLQNEYHLDCRNSLTGNIIRTVDAEKILDSRHNHYRCYESKATENFLIANAEGAEFIPWDGSGGQVNNWLRGTCKTGVMPANGMLYLPSHWCACAPNILLKGFLAIGPDGSSPTPQPSALQTGPAYNQSVPWSPPANPQNEWPTFRYNASRDGVSPSQIDAAMSTNWVKSVGGNLTPPVIADGIAVVISQSEYIVKAFDAENGADKWSFTPGGRVDSPPTLWQGRVFFGCADGYVYSLRGTDGALIWKLRVAPEERRIISEEHLESAWHVHGSVLLYNDVLYCAAGRSTFLDGGIKVVAINPETGAFLHTKNISTEYVEPASGNNTGDNNRYGGEIDIMMAANGNVYMRNFKLNPQLTTAEEESISWGPGGGVKGLAMSYDRLFTVATFLDKEFFHRMLWTYQYTWAQQLLVDGNMLYGFKAYDESDLNTPFLPAIEDKGYLLFAQNADLKLDASVRQAEGSFLNTISNMTREERANPHALPAFDWSSRLPIRAYAFIKAGDKLVVAGTPDIMPADDPYIAFDNEAGGKLWIINAANGTTDMEYDFSAPPVKGGLAVANGKLFVSTMDGNLICLSADGSGDNAPTAPGVPTKTSETTTSMSIQWAASTDDNGPVTYDVYVNNVRDPAAIDLTVTSATLNGLTCGTSYAIKIAAKDGVNPRVESASASLSTAACQGGDDEPPTTPGTPELTGTSQTSISISWTASTDDNGPVTYDVYVNNALTVADVTSASTTIDGLSCETTYAVKIAAKDGVNSAVESAAADLSTAACQSGGTVTVLNPGAESGKVDWTFDGNSDVIATQKKSGSYSFVVKRAGSTNDISQTISGLSPNTTYTLSAWILSGGSGNSILGVTDFGGTDVSVVQEPNADFAMNTVSFTTGASNTSATILLQIEANYQWGYFDDITVTGGPTGDDEPPSVPGTPVKTSDTETSISISWGASTDDNGPVTYDVYVNNVLTSTDLTITSATLSGLSCGTVYAVKVAAKDGVNSPVESSSANLSTAACQGGGDEPPTVPGTPVKTGESETSIDISWTASTDDNGSVTYDVYVDNVLTLSDLAGTSATLSGLNCGITYAVKVAAKDGVNPPVESSSANLSTSACQGGGTVTILNPGAESGKVDWTFDDNSDVSTAKKHTGSYSFVVKKAGSGSDISQTITGLSPNTSYTLSAWLLADGSGDAILGATGYGGNDVTAVQQPNNSFEQHSVQFTTGSSNTAVTILLQAGSNYQWCYFDDVTISGGPVGDDEPPSVPGTPVKTSDTETSISISWGASTDDNGPVTYDVYVNNVLTSPDLAVTSTTLSGLSCGTTYAVKVAAKDGVNSPVESSLANLSTAACQGGGDEPPTVPGTPIKTGESETSIDISWTASTDDNGSVTYDVYVDNALTLFDLAGTTATLNGLGCGNTYAVKVAAKDGVNPPVESSSANLSTTACQGGGEITIINPGFEDGTTGWTGSIESNTYNAHSGIQSVYVSRPYGPTAFSQTISNLAPNTDYTVSVWALDGGGSGANVVITAGGTSTTGTTGITWTQTSHTFNSGGSTTVTIQLGHDQSGWSWLYIDDVTIE